MIGKQGMKIAVTGASGLVGSQLVAFLSTGGHEIVSLVRAEPDRGQVLWNPKAGQVDTQGLAGVNAVVHLAGENIAVGRWSPAKKRRIRESRVAGSRLIAEKLAAMDPKPDVLVCASAIGYYGDRGATKLDESSDPGTGYLADVCRDWEDACQPAREAGIRVVNARIGVVITPRGGALAKMLPPFKMGVGGKVAGGDQFWSWVSIEDVVGALHHAIMNESISGPLNVVSPEPLTNSAFTKVLGKVLRRPTIFPMPAFVAKMALGEMANDLLLSSTRVLPTRLLETGYEFRHPTLETALHALLGK